MGRASGWRGSAWSSFRGRRTRWQRSPPTAEFGAGAQAIDSLAFAGGHAQPRLELGAQRQGGDMAVAAVPADLFDVTTTFALEEKKKLRKHFARFDILFFLICTLVGVDTLGAVASNGPQAFTWLIFLAVLFF